MRILQVEDDLFNAEFFRAVLEAEEHTIAWESSGTAGRARALAEAFDLIVLDIELPGLRGDALCRELKAAGVSTPIVAITASALPDQLASVRAAGFDECMTKPIEPAELRAMVRRFEAARKTG